MKLVIQIPCYNEEASLPATLEALPRYLPGFDAVEWLVVDDGSTDATVQVARHHGVDHVISHGTNKGLARAFSNGLRASLAANADVVVNFDADNQYRADDIPALVAPILEGRADLVVGCRPIGEIEYFSRTKKLLQYLGSWVVRQVSDTTVEDVTSGFRAMSRDAAMRLNVFSEYTYTLESLIQAGQKGMAVTTVPIRVNAPLRRSRLIKSVPAYILRSADTIVRIFMTYRPLQFFLIPGSLIFMVGLVLGVRFLYFYLSGVPGHVQSVVLSALLMGTGFFLGIIGLLADLIAVNRKMLEDVKWQLQQQASDRDRQEPD